MLSQVNLWEKAKGFAHVAISPANGLKHWQKFMGARMSKHRMYVSEIVLDNSFPQIKAVFKVLANTSSYPILILNKYGSDMVSIIISLTLLLLGSDMQSIHHDYMQTFQEWAGLKEQLLKDIRESGMTEDYIEPFLPFVNSLQQHIQNKHGGIEQYLLNTGVDQTELRAIKRILLPAPDLSEKHGWLLDIQGSDPLQAYLTIDQLSMTGKECSPSSTTELLWRQSYVLDAA
jgi:protein-tyrosine phosphatase